MSGAPEQAILLSQGSDRLRAIARGLFDGPIEELHPVGLSLKSAPPGPIERAELSATHGRSGFLKRQVLQGQWRWLWKRLERAPRSYVIVWNGIKGHRYLAAEAAKTLGHVPVYLEEAPLPGRLSVDFKGVNGGNSLPRHASDYAGPATDLVAIRDGLEARAARRADVAQDAADAALGSSPFIFAPLQVPGDSQITVYGDWITSVDQMIDAIVSAADHLPQGWHLRVKEHPSAKTSFADRISGPNVVLDNTTDTYAQVAASRGVVTINSSVGLHSMLWDKPVLALGEAFWGWSPLAERVSNEGEVAKYFGSPDWQYDQTLRQAFFGRLLEYFPTEEDVVAGRYPLSAI